MNKDNIFMKFLDLEKPKAEPVDQKVPAKVSKVYNRTMGDVYAPAEAQRIFNPALPAAPKPKGPTAKQAEMGTASALDMGGNWGSPERMNG